MSEPRMPTPLDGLGDNVADAFSGSRLVFHAGAIVATEAMVLSGADHAIHSELGHREGWTTVANIAGYVAPLATASAIWLVGLATRDRTVAGAGSAALQALAVTAATTGLLKVVTGRPFPTTESGDDTFDRSQELNPFQEGLAAWPSGHTSTAISVAAALTAYAPEKPWIPAVGYPIALAIGYGMIDRDSHWASDVVAGALIGHAIGYSIGRSFRKRVREGRTSPDLQLVPLAEATGLAVRGSW